MNFVARYFPDSEPGWAQLGFERASPVCLVLARLGNVRDLTGINIATGFERGLAGPAQTARSSLDKSRPGSVQDMHGLPSRCCPYHGLILGLGQPGWAPAGNQQG